MPTTARTTSSFSFDTWEEEPVLDELGVRIYRTYFVKRLAGDLTGNSVGHMLMVNVGGAPAAYCGFEVVTGSLAGRSGTFLFHHNAAAGVDGGLSITVVPGSGTRELEGVEGAALIEVAGEVGDTTAPHRLVFDYRMP
jgi:hypothetical protein